MFDREDDITPPKTTEVRDRKQRTEFSKAEPKTNLFWWIGGFVLIAIFAGLFLLIYTQSNNDNTPPLPNSNQNGFIDIRGKYTGRGKVISLSITSLTNQDTTGQDSTHFDFEYTCNYAGGFTRGKILKGKGVYTVKNKRPLDFENANLGTAFLRTYNNTLTIKNDSWTVTKQK